MASGGGFPVCPEIFIQYTVLRVFHCERYQIRTRDHSLGDLERYQRATHLLTIAPNLSVSYSQPMLSRDIAPFPKIPNLKTFPQRINKSMCNVFTRLGKICKCIYCIYQAKTISISFLFVFANHFLANSLAQYILLKYCPVLSGRQKIETEAQIISHLLGKGRGKESYERGSKKRKGIKTLLSGKEETKEKLFCQDTIRERKPKYLEKERKEKYIVHCTMYIVCF